MTKVSKRTAIPDSAIRIRTYANLIPWIEQYRAGKFNCLTILSSPGLFKTTLLRDLVGRAVLPPQERVMSKPSKKKQLKQQKRKKAEKAKALSNAKRLETTTSWL